MWSGVVTGKAYSKFKTGIRNGMRHMRVKSPDLRLFADHLPDSFLKPLEFISYLKVICAQSWGPKEPIWDLRSPKMSS